MTYLEFQFVFNPLQPTSDILVAELSVIGFESFVEQTNGLTAFIAQKDFKESQLQDVFILQSKEFQIEWTSKVVEQQNWNAAWEKSFDPILVDDRCLVRAPFHEKMESEYEIIIEPKMSFGTGHHETTHMMLQHILQTDFERKTVLDMGCGTAVLGVLAAMRGAKEVDAIDVDNWCYLNSLENCERNHCKNINVFEGDASLLKGKQYDIIIANINRNILLNDIPKYVSSLHRGGVLFLSGFYLNDLDMISAKCEASGLQFEKNIEKNNWVAAKYVF